MSQEFFDKGKEVLRVLNANGFEAFFQGKGVEQKLLGKEVTSLDIITSAQIEQIKAIFIGHIEADDVRSVSVTIDSYPFTIYTFMQNDKLEIAGDYVHYSRGLYEDMSCRDFSLECVIMSHSGNVKDFYDGKEDLMNHTLYTLKKANDALREKPIIMLKALALASDDYKLSYDLKSCLRTKAKYLKKVNAKEALPYLKQIFDSKNVSKTLKFMDKYDLTMAIPFFRKAFSKMKKKKTILSYEDFLILAFVLEEEFDEEMLYGVKNIELFKKVYNIALTNPKCKFDLLTMYSAGIDVLLSALRVNKVLHNSCVKEKDIIKAYDALPIKKTCDLAFKGEDILALCENTSSDAIMMLVDEIVYQVLNGVLPNEYEAIKAFAMGEINKNKDLYSNAIPIYPVTEEEIKYPKLGQEEGFEEKSSLIEDIENKRLDILEKRLEEQTRTIEEKDKLIEELLANGNTARMYSDVNQLVNDCIVRLKELNYMQDDDYVFEARLKELLMNHLTRKDQ